MDYSHQINQLTLLTETGYEEKDFNTLIAAWKQLLRFIDETNPVKDHFKRYNDLKLSFHKAIDAADKKACYDLLTQAILWIKEITKQ